MCEATGQIHTHPQIRDKCCVAVGQVFPEINNYQLSQSSAVRKFSELTGESFVPGTATLQIASTPSLVAGQCWSDDLCIEPPGDASVAYLQQPDGAECK